MTKETQELEKRFEAIQAYILSGCKVLPDEFDGDCIDGKYFELFHARKFNSDRARYSKTDEDEFKKIYFAKYYNDKRELKMNSRIAKENLDRRVKHSTLVTALLKKDMPYNVYESMIKVFELLGAVMNDELSANLLKEKLVPFWLTGCKNLTEEETETVLKNAGRRNQNEGE